MKNCTRIPLLSLSLLFAISILPSHALASEYTVASCSLSASAAVLYETQAEEFLFVKNADKRMPMASTTKIMTALAAREALSLEQIVPIPREAVGIEGSSAYLTQDERWTVKDLLYALLLQSANDAAVALAIASDGSTEAFVARMNRMAQEWQLCDTHFENPHGLHADTHYTTAKELAIIASKLQEDPFLKQVCATKVYRTQCAAKARIFSNHNKLLSKNKNANGIKTGYTRHSGRCLVGAVEKDGLSLISVTLNAPDDWNDHEKMWTYAFDNYERRDILPQNGYFANIPVVGSIVPYATASNREPIRLFMRKNDAKISFRTEYHSYAIAPIQKNELLGYLCVMQNGKEIYRIPLCADTDIPKIKISKK